MSDNDQPLLDADTLLAAYASCCFPMGDDDGTIEWYDPVYRGVFYPDKFHVPRSVLRLLNNNRYAVEVNQRFTEVVLACGSQKAGREGTWINAPIVEAYAALHRNGHAHSIEVVEDGSLVGGLYGVSLGAAFFGESMFSFVTGGSKIALVHTAARLKAARFELFDAQYHTPHLAQFGCVEIHRRGYKRRLNNALKRRREFPTDLSPEQLAAFASRRG